LKKTSPNKNQKEMIEMVIYILTLMTWYYHDLFTQNMTAEVTVAGENHFDDDRLDVDDECFCNC